MILFILEGKKREPALFKTLDYLFFSHSHEEKVICSFGNNIYNLYNQLKEFGEDIISVVKSRLIKSQAITEEVKNSDFSEVFLYFDYDPQDRYADDNKIKEMLNYFDNETENGKLYISYPMIESISYTKELPDKDFYTYSCKLSDVKSFKQQTLDFSFYKSLDFILCRINKKDNKLITPTKEKKDKLTQNWTLLRNQNVSKANYICSGNNLLPERKETISQKNIFDSQLSKYISKTKKEIAILNPFPLFLYEYF